jgi:hypothetical protein
MCISAVGELCAAETPRSEVSFAYSISHPVTPLSPEVLADMVNADAPAVETDSPEVPALEASVAPADSRAAQPRKLSHTAMCNAIAAAARANELPAPFFANLIWQESGFRPPVVSPAGAQGVAQFMPETAKEYGLVNPFDPVHALQAAGRFLRKLQAQFGNLGLAAAAYNAGPGRVLDWIARRRTLPGETRNYVARITGRTAERWTSAKFARGPEATVMPAKAPCPEITEEAKMQSRLVQALRDDMKGQQPHASAKVAARHRKHHRKLASGSAHESHHARTHTMHIAKTTASKPARSAASAHRRTRLASAR